MSKPDSCKNALSSRLLSRLGPWRDAAGWRIAFSGGLDSTVLLHLLAELSRHQRLPPLTAIHIHHGLQAVAASWPGHCRQVCQILGVPLQVIDVQVRPGASLEQAARDARYAAFNQVLQTGEVLLTAQHRDDQAETLMFRLLRGAGVRGLAAMPSQRELGIAPKGGSGGCQASGSRMSPARSIGPRPRSRCVCRAMACCRFSGIFLAADCMCITEKAGRCWMCLIAGAGISSACLTKRAYRCFCAADCRCCIAASNCWRSPICPASTPTPVATGDCTGSHRRMTTV